MSSVMALSEARWKGPKLGRNILGGSKGGVAVLFFLGSAPSAGLILMTLRSRLAGTTDGASQAPQAP